MSEQEVLVRPSDIKIGDFLQIAHNDFARVILVGSDASYTRVKVYGLLYDVIIDAFCRVTVRRS